MTYKTKDGREYIYCKRCRVKEFNISKIHHKVCGRKYTRNPTPQRHSSKYVQGQMNRI